jgi:hypothetical protein
MANLIATSTIASTKGSKVWFSIQGVFYVTEESNSVISKTQKNPPPETCNASVRPHDSDDLSLLVVILLLAYRFSGASDGVLGSLRV